MLPLEFPIRLADFKTLGLKDLCSVHSVVFCSAVLYFDKTLGNTANAR
jgi:hypothetical protein